MRAQQERRKTAAPKVRNYASKGDEEGARWPSEERKRASTTVKKERTPSKKIQNDLYL